MTPAIAVGITVVALFLALVAFLGVWTGGKR